GENLSRKSTEWVVNKLSVWYFESGKLYSFLFVVLSQLLEGLGSILRSNLFDGLEMWRVFILLGFFFSFFLLGFFVCNEIQREFHMRYWR
ncbi:unnamed protein product, partial [Coccothraustes coccothraustes]